MEPGSPGRVRKTLYRAREVKAIKTRSLQSNRSNREISEE